MPRLIGAAALLVAVALTASCGPAGSTASTGATLSPTSAPFGTASPSPTSTALTSTVSPTPTPTPTVSTPAVRKPRLPRVKPPQRPEPKPTATKRRPPPAPARTRRPPAPARIVHPGSFCSPPGAVGRTRSGTRMVCGSRGGDRARWRSG
ncbi:hypothetical protein [Nonomuraea dietziae]|uniref:Uncharacterized protein n=1 Tax=Nonomuraea dietziae TaxID=65515 RepID=A0A7W5VCP8_9ACTN|nr:hypothetical protein [Nonomuraea dietziae]MBB3732431.1 hypothetical protein [Nonomuraea dietziae]